MNTAPPASSEHVRTDMKMFKGVAVRIFDYWKEWFSGETRHVHNNEPISPDVLETVFWRASKQCGDYGRARSYTFKKPIVVNDTDLHVTVTIEVWPERAAREAERIKLLQESEDD